MTPSQVQDANANDLACVSVRRPWLAVVMNLLIVVAGFGAISGIEVRELPDVDRPIVTVRGEYQGHPLKPWMPRWQAWLKLPSPE